MRQLDRSTVDNPNGDRMASREGVASSSSKWRENQKRKSGTYSVTGNVPCYQVPVYATWDTLKVLSNFC